MFQGSKEYPNKKTNVLDNSITFTDDANNKNHLRTLENKEKQNKYISELDLTNDDLNYSKNSIGETKKVTNSKMIQTI